MFKLIRTKNIYNGFFKMKEVILKYKKYDGSWTYFASDMAYHLDKYQRGFNRMINIWGFDHGGYVKRMTSAVSALTKGEAILDVKLCQLVSLIRDGQQIKMSKLQGNYKNYKQTIKKL